MGRYCGDLAMFSSIAEAAELTITYDYQLEESILFRKLRKLKAQRKSHAIVIVSENLLDVNELSKRIEKETGFETRPEILGRLQRGGSPCAFDRILASRLGSFAIECLCKDICNIAVGEIKGEIVATPIEKAITMKRDTHKSLINLIDMLQ
jgi:6-phosphofructokinase 1